MFILFRQTLLTAVAFAFAVTAGQVRAENSFSTLSSIQDTAAPIQEGFPVK